MIKGDCCRFSSSHPISISPKTTMFTQLILTPACDSIWNMSHFAPCIQKIIKE